MTEETREYIDTWNKKIETYKGKSLVNLFDKYNALYTLYNRLYNEVYKSMKAKNLVSKSRYSDFEKATGLILKYVGPEKILKEFKLNRHFQDAQDVADLIRMNIFHINLDDGRSNKEIDNELMRNLENSNADIKCQAVLSAIYNVRCNIVHGEKSFEEHQRLLLTPLIKMLRTTIDLLINKLKEDKD